MFNFAADSDIYQRVSRGDAHKQPAPRTEASWPEGGDRRKQRWSETERRDTQHYDFLIERERNKQWDGRKRENVVIQDFLFGAAYLLHIHPLQKELAGIKSTGGGSSSLSRQHFFKWCCLSKHIHTHWLSLPGLGSGPPFFSQVPPHRKDLKEALSRFRCWLVANQILRLVSCNFYL